MSTCNEHLRPHNKSRPRPCVDGIVLHGAARVRNMKMLRDVKQLTKNAQATPLVRQRTWVHAPEGEEAHLCQSVVEHRLRYTSCTSTAGPSLKRRVSTPFRGRTHNTPTREHTQQESPLCYTSHSDVHRSNCTVRRAAIDTREHFAHTAPGEKPTCNDTGCAPALVVRPADQGPDITHWTEACATRSMC